MQTLYVKDESGQTVRVDAVQYNEAGAPTAYFINGGWRSIDKYVEITNTVIATNEPVEPIVDPESDPADPSINTQDDATANASAIPDQQEIGATNTKLDARVTRRKSNG